MKIRRLHLSRFTAFEDVHFDFAPEVNVLIGENATGKSHVLKLLYVINEAVRGVRGGRQPSAAGGAVALDEALRALLMETFLPDKLGRLVRRGVGRRSAQVEVEWASGERLVFLLTSMGALRVLTEPSQHLTLGRSVFVPPREVLSIFPGFISAWQNRESSFDRTYYDLCVALDARPLRGARDGRRADLLAPLEAALAGTVKLENGRFYIHLPDGDMEAPLVAEGLRKLAMLAYLVVNGSLSENAFLFWDEPEANMNPKLAHLLGKLILAFGAWGVQVFTATHDYALASELSLELHHRRDAPLLGTASPDSAAFFGLGRSDTHQGVRAERASRMEEITDNPILEALASLHDRELAVDGQ